VRRESDGSTEGEEDDEGVTSLNLTNRYIN
jgi:hypothetical protein